MRTAATLEEALATIQSQRDEIGALLERIAELERAFGLSGPAAPIEFGLTAAEDAVFGVLMRREFAAKATLMHALVRWDGSSPGAKIIDVYVCKMRRKLRPFGVAIETKWGQGYLMSAQDKAKVATFGRRLSDGGTNG